MIDDGKQVGCLKLLGPTLGIGERGGREKREELPVVRTKADIRPGVDHLGFLG